MQLSSGALVSAAKRAAAFVLLLLCSLLSAGSGAANDDEEVDEERARDILGTLVVEASEPRTLGKKLMRIAIEPTLSAAEQDVLVHSVIKRDFELSGEFALLAPSRFPDVDPLKTGPPDLDAWQKTGIEALLRLRGSESPPGQVELAAEVYLSKYPKAPPERRVERAPLGKSRVATHRLADSLIEVLTGYRGGFASQLTFVLSGGHARRVYVMDADGFNLHNAAPDHNLVSASNFGHNDELLFASSQRHGAYKLYRSGSTSPLTVTPRGSIYGIALDASRDRIALSIANRGDVKVFAGTITPLNLALFSQTRIALHPAFSPTGKLAYAGINEKSHRIYVDNRAASPPGLQASAPTFCAHPQGTRLVYTVGIAKRTDLVASNDQGGGVVRLTQGPGSNRYPACSPDGRLIAFFSTRQTHEGPGLYIMPLTGGRPKRVSAFVGDTLRWSRLTTEP